MIASPTRGNIPRSLPPPLTEKTIEQLVALSAYLAARRETILEAWHRAADADPAQTTVSFLTRSQFDDHIPHLLDAFERKLRARPGGSTAAAADQTKTQEDVKHGLQRWQQGYRLTELMHEWGHLHLCVFAELESFAAANPQTDREALVIAQRELIELINEGVNESAGQYARMQQAEAAGHVRDLQRTLANATEVERRRSELIRQAVHDLRGNVQSVSTAAEVLCEANIAASERIEFAGLVQQGVESVTAMLVDLMALARLEARQEPREIAAVDAARLIAELCATAQPIAATRNLFLKTAGPSVLNVQADAGKVRRLLQNLLFNALKYTEIGGVSLSWGETKERWWVIVKDTGPGLMAGPGSPIAAGLTAATDAAREAEKAAPERPGEAPAVLPIPPGGRQLAQRRHQPTGEGIGLSIVKRLCELLDATLELTSSLETGTTFRVVFPSRY
jgi:signal transduction histidine kinase